MHFSNFKTRAKSIGLFDVQVWTGKRVSKVVPSLERNPELIGPRRHYLVRHAGIHHAAVVGIGGHHKFATAQAQQVSSRMIRRNRTIDSAGGGLSALATLTCCKASWDKQYSTRMRDGSKPSEAKSNRAHWRHDSYS